MSNVPPIPTAYSVFSPPPPPPQPPRRSGFKTFLKVVVFLMLVGSIGLNLILLIALGITGSAKLSGGGNGVEQEVVVDGGSDKVAVLPIYGEVGDGMAESVRQYIKAVKEDSSIKAIVLEVESPGGGVTASDEIYHMLSQLKESNGIKIVVNMRSLAASGAYYISMSGDEIYAEPTTLVGSIGVIMPLFEATELLNKIGVKPEVIASDQAKFKQAGDPWYKLKPEDREYMRALVNDMHEKFCSVVKAGRKWPETKDMGEIATGQVWTAKGALDKGLIDKIGYQDDAVKEAAALAKISNPTVVKLKERHGLLEALTASSAVGGARVEITPQTIDAIKSLASPRMEYKWAP